MKQIILRPLLTEQTLALAAKGWFTFAVYKSAHKGEIARNIETLYKVTVRSVRTVTMHGKSRRVGKKMMPIVRTDWKKAHVKLAKGQTIDAFEVAPQEEKK